MPLIDPTRVLNNLIVLGILLGLGLMIYFKMEKDKREALSEFIKKMLGSKEE